MYNITKRTTNTTNFVFPPFSGNRMSKSPPAA